ncbi:S1C family serine protease [Conexibacter sp. SYSU D00693]|uniref:S1C family serine protease n=1 Tax=Conexibacter sp. SYSU D00693 TaxID=2812560 RepID=UPI00196BABC6|nr:trypsin-like peptidase domain-containing protein [Conexibacter sp. SYSU D00693]
MSTTTPSSDREPLWAGEYRDRVDDAPAGDGAAAGAPTAVHPPRAAGAGRRAGHGRRVAVGAAVAVAAGVAAGVLGVSILGGGEDPSSSSARAGTAAPLSASTSPAPQGTVASVVAKASPAVVSVRTSSGEGTGFLLDREGTIVTNAHVVGDAQTVRVQFGEDGERATGRVLGSDPSSDLAAVQIPTSAASGVTPLPLAADSTVRVGAQVVAIGNPFGLDRTATSGIVSATGRSIEAPNGFSISDAIQTDAPINPGNSGGPLLDAAGRVIGVNSQIATSGAGGGNVGVGFAVPSSLVQRIVPSLKTGTAIARPYLGVSTGETASGAGAQVASVEQGGPADDAGLEVGDVVTSVDGTAVSEPDDIAAAIARKAPGDRVTVQVRRGGGSQAVDVELGTRPAQASSATPSPGTP